MQNYNPVGRILLLAKSALFIFMALLVGCKEELQTTDAGNLVPKTVIENPTLPAITVNGTSLHAETFGNPDSAMIVVIHGGPGGDYRSLLHCKDLADAGYFVVFYDQRGSGLSQRHSKDIYSIQIMIDDLNAVIQHYRRSADQKVFLFGHSWGAMLATAYINAYPDAVNGAVLAEPGGFTWKDTYTYIQRSQKIDLFSESTNDVLFTDQFLTGKEDEHAILDYKLELASAFENSTTSYTKQSAGNRRKRWLRLHHQSPPVYHQSTVLLQCIKSCLRIGARSVSFRGLPCGAIGKNQ
jgi:proline iminopeptidase